jgi:hypothetical protein
MNVIQEDLAVCRWSCEQAWISGTDEHGEALVYSVVVGEECRARGHALHRREATSR